jgi:neutral amino acid transport system permease protein
VTDGTSGAEAAPVGGPGETATSGPEPKGRGLRRLLPAERDDRWFVYWPVCIVVLVVAYNLLPGAYGEYVVSVAVLGTVFSLGAIGLNVQFGFTGLLNFGQVMFLMVGAYTTAILVIDLGWNLFVAMVLGAVMAAILGLVVGSFSIRLRGDYLAIVTISVAEMIRIIIHNSGGFRIDPATGESEFVGTGGVIGLKDFAGGFDDTLKTLLPFLDNRQWRLFVFNALLVTLFLFVTWTVKRSPWGRTARAIREDELIAEALGKPTFVRKLQSFSLGAFIGAFAGVSFALQSNFVEPGTWVPLITFRLWIAIILGGAGTIFGPVLGALVLQLLFSLVRFLPRVVNTPLFEWVPEDAVAANRLGALEGMLLGLLIVTLVVLRPQGILGTREDVVLERR